MAEGDLTLATLPQAARFSIRGGATAETLIGVAIGLRLPWSVCRAESGSGRSALWLGPDEWLLIAPAREGRALASRIAAGLAGEPASVVDISDRNVAISVSGARAADVLNAFVPLDLDLAAFTVGMCTRTVFAKAEVVLWRTAPEEFRIEVWRSFAPYVMGSLEEAGREYGPVP